MLRCRDGSYYAGHTDDLEVRMAQHARGTIPGYTHDPRPVELVWCGDAPTRDEAFAMERRIKGWSRAKKEALIAGDWERISELARNRSGPWIDGRERFERTLRQAQGERGMGGEPLPSSAQPEPVEGGLAGARSPQGALRQLHYHPALPPKDIESVAVTAALSRDKCMLTYRVIGDAVMVAQAVSKRADGLWEHTCFELFVQPAGGLEYFEFNFSPSTQWAAYRLEDYRTGMSDLAIDAPAIERLDYGVRVTIDLGRLPPGNWQIGLSAVIEELDGTKSYWALAHPPGAPDFHDPACFALELPAPRFP
ncbi:MAG TPA: GIY-YIG nuclease family protein [Sphingomonas sp.]|jgi:predicted GIY-YIG superfamily endonuclease